MSSTSTLEIDLIEKTVEKRKKIMEDAKKKTQEILKSAELESSKITSDTDKQILLLMSSELKTVRDRIIGQTELENRKELMQVRENILNDLYKKVEDKIKIIVDSKSDEYDYQKILNNLIIEGVNAIEDEDFIISANKKDLELLKKNIKKIEKNLEKKTLKLDKNPINVLGGVIIKNSAGNKIYYNTLDGRLEKVKKTMNAKIAEILGVI